MWRKMFYSVMFLIIVLRKSLLLKSHRHILRSLRWYRNMGMDIVCVQMACLQNSKECAIASYVQSSSFFTHKPRNFHFYYIHEKYQLWVVGRKKCKIKAKGEILEEIVPSSVDNLPMQQLQLKNNVALAEKVEHLKMRIYKIFLLLSPAPQLSN